MKTTTSGNLHLVLGESIVGESLPLVFDGNCVLNINHNTSFRYMSTKKLKQKYANCVNLCVIYAMTSRSTIVFLSCSRLQCL
jgi:hypothetical protein